MEKKFSKSKQKKSSNQKLCAMQESNGLHDRKWTEIGSFMLNNSPIGFFRSTPDPDSKFLFANPAFVKMFGYQNIDELESIHCFNTYWEPSERKEIVEILLTEGLIEKKEIQLKRKDGTAFWGSLTAKVVSNKSDNIIYFDGAVIDITNRKDSERHLMEEKNFSESIIESMPGLFWQFDESGHCSRWNKNVEAVYGYTSKELHDLHALKDMVTPENTQKLLDAAKDAMEGGSGYCEYDVITKYGEKIAFAGDARMVTINGKKYLTAVEIDITKRKVAEDKLKVALDEIRRLKEKTEAENVFLIDEINKSSEYGNVVGQSKLFKKVLSTARKVAPTNATTLLLGESGTGKGVLAQLIHNLSPRHDKPLIKINCANLPANLLESILFGHEKGAFTNATSRKAGRFEVADGSTIFLDEIAELPLELQSKLLRVIEDGEFERLGGSKTIRVDVRIIAATNRNLDEEVNAGRFRLDLMYRLNVYPITCPPLRKRRSDIPLLAHHLINKFNKSFGKSVSKISNKAMESLKNYPWPGNIRELQNVIERAIINTEGKSLDISGFESPNQLKSKTKILAEVERNHIISILEETDWVIEGKKGAATILGINPSTLRGRMRKYSVQRPGNVTKF